MSQQRLQPIALAGQPAQGTLNAASLPRQSLTIAQLCGVLNIGRTTYTRLLRLDTVRRADGSVRRLGRLLPLPIPGWEGGRQGAPCRYAPQTVDAWRVRQAETASDLRRLFRGAGRGRTHAGSVAHGAGQSQGRM